VVSYGEASNEMYVVTKLFTLGATEFAALTPLSNGKFRCLPTCYLERVDEGSLVDLSQELLTE
jgi:hypothetical protein